MMMRRSVHHDSHSDRFLYLQLCTQMKMLSANPLKPELYAKVKTDPFSINKLIPVIIGKGISHPVISCPMEDFQISADE